MYFKYYIVMQAPVMLQMHTSGSGHSGSSDMEHATQAVAPFQPVVDKDEDHGDDDQ
jgi:hypothetical protein